MTSAKKCFTCGKVLVDRRFKYCSDSCKKAQRLEYDKKRRPPICVSCGGERPRINGRRLCDTCLDLRKPVWAREGSRKKAQRDKERRAKEGRSRTIKVRDDGFIWCPRCVQYLPPDDFKEKKKNAYCIECSSNYAHEHRLRSAFGITPEQYEDMMEFQNGVCAICLKKPRARRLAVDHNHKTGEVRGLLCTRCNHKILGASGENPDVLRRAADYLDKTVSQRMGWKPVIVPDTVKGLGKK